MAGGAVHVAVVGAGEASAALASDAQAVGRGLAQRGTVLVCGGLGGVMEAACRGARAADGRTVGILPGLDRRAANPWVEAVIPTGLGELRNGLVVRAADALIAVGGGYGTLSEIALALKGGVPVVGLGTWDLGAAGRGGGPGVRAAATPAEAVEQALALAAATGVA